MDQLNRVLYKELCVELLKDYKKHPKEFDAFVMSGKEPFNAFLEVCQSVKFLSISGTRLTVKFSDPVIHIDLFPTRKNSVANHFIRNMFMFTKSVQFMGNYDQWSLLYLKELKHLDELEIDQSYMHYSNGTFVYEIFKHVVSVKRMISSLDVYRIISKDFKLDKMTVKFRENETIEDLFKLFNSFPKELEIDHQACSSKKYCFRAVVSCPKIEKFFKNFEIGKHSNGFGMVKKLVFHGLSDVFFSDASTFLTVIGRIVMSFPELEELVFDSGLIPCDDSNGDKAKEFVDSLHNCLAQYHGKLKLSMVYRAKYSAHFNYDYDACTVSSEFTTALKGYQLSKRQEGDEADYTWKNTFYPVPNASLEVEIFMHEVDESPKNRYIDDYPDWNVQSSDEDSGESFCDNSYYD